MKLTKLAIDKMVYAKINDQRDVRWDDVLAGFGIRIYPPTSSGVTKKAYVLSYRISGRKRLITIGYHGVLTLEQARSKAIEYLVAVKNDKDPLLVRKNVNKAKTVKDLCDDYIIRHAKPHKKSWKKDQSHIDRFIIPNWGSQKAMNIKQSDVFNLHAQVGETRPYEANRLLTLLAKMFVLAIQWGFVPDGFKNPATGIKKYKEEKRDRWVTPEELKVLAQIIEDEPNIYVRKAVLLYLYTGLRKTELLTAKWADINWSRKELRIGKNKSGNTHYVPLTTAAIELLNSIPKIQGNDYILPGRKVGCHLVNISKPWVRIRKKALLEDVRLHDLRRTVGSWMVQSGSSLHLVGKILNHSSIATTAIYARFAQDDSREALERHGKALNSTIANVDDPKVLNFPFKSQTIT